jgi:XTP/dITP diphosphohydrolase
MTDPSEWVLASSNAGKLAEYRALLATMPIALRALDAAAGEAPDETGLTFVENALIKARHAAAVTGLPAIADDSGLCVAALGDAPGVLSARYAGAEASDRDNIARLLAALAAVEPENRAAAFHCVVVALRAPDDPAPVVAHGVWRGRIAPEPAGAHGFGYDPVFFDPALGLTAAELDPALKNRVSHRASASAELRRRLGL